MSILACLNKWRYKDIQRIPFSKSSFTSKFCKEVCTFLYLLVTHVLGKSQIKYLLGCSSCLEPLQLVKSILSKAMEMKYDGIHTHLATLVCTVLDFVSGLFLWANKLTNKSSKMEGKHPILLDQFKRHIYNDILASLLFIGPPANELGSILTSFCPSFQQFYWKLIMSFF